MLNIYDENLIPTRTLADIIGVDPNQILVLEDQGLFKSVRKSGKKFYDLYKSVRAYIDKMRGRGRSAPEELPDNLNPEIDEARRIKADADWREERAKIEQLKRMEFEGIMHRSEDIEMVMGDFVNAVRSNLIALPGMIAMDMATATSPKECEGIAKRAVTDILHVLHEYQYDSSQYTALVRQREKWMREQEPEEVEDLNGGVKKRRGRKPKNK